MSKPRTQRRPCIGDSDTGPCIISPVLRFSREVRLGGSAFPHIYNEIGIYEYIYILICNHNYITISNHLHNFTNKFLRLIFMYRYRNMNLIYSDINICIQTIIFGLYFIYKYLYIYVWLFTMGFVHRIMEIKMSMICFLDVGGITWG